MKNQHLQPSVVDEAVMAPIQARIQCVRNVQVMLDRDLAELYGVPVKRLNEQVKRNAQYWALPCRLYVSAYQG